MGWYQKKITLCSDSWARFCNLWLLIMRISKVYYNKSRLDDKLSKKHKRDYLQKPYLVTRFEFAKLPNKFSTQDRASIFMEIETHRQRHRGSVGERNGFSGAGRQEKQRKSICAKRCKNRTHEKVRMNLRERKLPWMIVWKYVLKMTGNRNNNIHETNYIKNN